MQGQGMTLKQFAKARFFRLCDAMQEAKKNMDTEEGKAKFIVLSVQLQAAKADVPKSYWKFAR